MSTDGGRGAVVPGVLIGTVSDNQDPLGLGRVKVRLLSGSTAVETNWARIATPMAGNGWGMRMVPDLETQVLVAFERGDPESPLVIGGLWNSDAPPPAIPDEAAADNNLRVIHTRSGHRLTFDDTEGAERIELADMTGKNLLVIDSAANAISLTCEGVMTVTAKEGIVLDAGSGDMSFKCNNLKIDATAEVGIAAGSAVKIEGKSEVGLSGGQTSTLAAKAGTLAINGIKVVVNDGALEVQ